MRKIEKYRRTTRGHAAISVMLALPVLLGFLDLMTQAVVFAWGVSLSGHAAVRVARSASVLVSQRLENDAPNVLGAAKRVRLEEVARTALAPLGERLAMTLDVRDGTFGPTEMIEVRLDVGLPCIAPMWGRLLCDEREGQVRRRWVRHTVYMPNEGHRHLGRR